MLHRFKKDGTGDLLPIDSVDIFADVNEWASSATGDPAGNSVVGAALSFSGVA